MKRFVFCLASFVMLILCVFTFTACKENDEDATITGISVQLVNENYQLIDNTINVVYGAKVELKYSDFKVIASLDNGNTKQLSKKSGNTDGYTFQSSIPQSYDKTPANNYTIVISYGEFEPIVIRVKVAKADFSGSLNWNYENAFVYDGEEKTVEIIDLPDGVVANYSGTTSAIDTGTYTCSVSFTCTNSNYKSISDMALTWSIAPAPIDVGEIAFVTKTYDTTTHVAQMEDIELPSNVEVESVSGQTTATDVGTYEVTVTFVVTGEDADNYYVEPITTTWEIVKGTYMSVGSVSFDGQSAFVYDGTARTIALDYSALDSNVRVVGTPTNLTATNAGEYEVVITLEYVGDNENYEIEAGAITLNWEIEKAPLTITASNHMLTYGDELSFNGIEDIEGFVNGEDEAVLVGQLEYSCEYSQYDNAGNYDINISGYSSDNYEITYVAGTLTIAKKSLVITPNNVSVKYTEAVEYKGVSAEGFVGQDTLENLGGSPVFTSVYTNTTPVGTYDLEVSGYTSNNYGISYEKGMLIVVKNTIDVSMVALVDDELVFNREVQEVAVNNSTLPSGVSVTNIVMDKDGKATRNVDVYTAVVSLTYVDTTNYELIPDVYLTWQIIKADVDVSGYSYISNQLAYNGTLQSVAFTELPAGAEIKEITGNTGKDVNLYHCQVTIGCSDTDNYNDFTEVKAFNWRIAPLKLTIKAKNNTITYGDIPMHNGYETVTGFAPGENMSVLSGEIVYRYSYTLGGDVGTYVINIQSSTLTSNNYDITFVNATLTVVAKEVDLIDYWEEWQTEDVRRYHPTIAFTPVIINLPTGVRAYYTYTLNDGSNTEVISPIAVGFYMATAQLVKENNNYTLINNNGVGAFSFEIVKGEIDASKLTWSVVDGAEVEYNGESLKPTFTETIIGLEVDYIYYQNNGSGYVAIDNNADIKAVGDYKVVAEFSYDVDCYDFIPATIIEVEYSIIKAVVKVNELEWEFDCEKDGENENNITYSAVLEWTGENVAIALKAVEHLKIEYTKDTEYSATIPTIIDRGEHVIKVKVSIADGYEDRYELDGGYSEYLITLNVELKLIVFTEFILNGREADIETLTNDINKVSKYATLQFSIKDRYAFVVDIVNDNGDECWNIVDGYFEFIDYDKTFTFYVVDKNINSPLNKYATESGIVYMVRFEVNFVNQVIYGRENYVCDNPDGVHIDYELLQGENSFSITFDDDSLQRLEGFKFSYLLIDTEIGWTDNYAIESFPLVFDDLSTIRVIMIFVEVGENNNRSIIQFGIIPPTFVKGYETTYVELATGETKVSNTVRGSMGETIVDAFVIGFEVFLKDGYEDYTIAYFGDENLTKPVDYTNIGMLYEIYYVIFDGDENAVEYGAYYYAHAFCPTNAPGLALNCQDPDDEVEYLDWVCVDYKNMSLEYNIVEDGGITISQTYNGADTLTLVDGAQVVDYVLTISYMGVDYIFAVPFEVVCTLNIINCFTQEVKDSYNYWIYNTAETISYNIKQYNTLNYIDISDEYTAENINDFERVLQELIFPMDIMYNVTSKTIVEVNDVYYIKLNVSYTGNDMVDTENRAKYYYIELVLGESQE